jgi:hypothetical protein
LDLDVDEATTGDAQQVFDLAERVKIGWGFFFFGMSLQPRQEAIWKSIDAVRDSFRCSR